MIKVTTVLAHTSQVGTVSERSNLRAMITNLLEVCDRNCRHQLSFEKENMILGSIIVAEWPSWADIPECT